MKFICGFFWSVRRRGVVQIVICGSRGRLDVKELLSGMPGVKEDFIKKDYR